MKEIKKEIDNLKKEVDKLSAKYKALEFYQGNKKEKTEVLVEMWKICECIRLLHTHSVLLIADEILK